MSVSNVADKPTYISHYGLRTKRLKEMIQWYEIVFGAKIQHENEFLAFMTFDDEHHRLVIWEDYGTLDKPEDAAGIDHVGYGLASFRDLVGVYERLKAKGITPFLPLNHRFTTQVEALVKRIEREQGRLDILVNDIWGGEHLTEWYKPVWEHSLEKGLHQMRLAIDTHIVTSHFALPLLIKKPGGLVVELTDGTVEYNKEKYRLSLFYDLCKTSINRIAWAQAQELQAHQCTAISLTPGWLRSEQMLDNYDVKEANWRDAIAKQPHFAITETPRYVGRAVAALAADPDLARWNGQSLSSGQLAKIYGFTDLDGSQPDAWRYVVEVQDAGKPADVTGYR